MRVLALANLYRADHAAQLDTYRPLNAAASGWNGALFAELSKLDFDLDVVQFWPIRHQRRLREGRTTYHYLPRVPYFDGFTSLVKRARITALLRELKPDVLHGIGSEHGYVWPVVGRAVPSIVTIHGYLRVINSLAGHASTLKQNFLVREERRALLQADRVVAINGYMRDRFVADGVDVHRIAVIPNALNPLYLEPLPEQLRDIDILMVGTIHPLKNLHVALKIFEELATRSGLRPRVVVAGAPSVRAAHYYESLLADRESAGLGNVTFVGKLSVAELRKYYRRARFLLHVSAFETDSVVVTEALASGVVPIVNPVAALTTRVTDAVTGHHLQIGDVAQAAKRLQRILTDDSQRASIVNAHSPAAMSRYGPGQIAMATLAEYKRLFEHRTGQIQPNAVPEV